MYWSLYLMKLQGSSQELYWKRDPDADVFLQRLQDF